MSGLQSAGIMSPPAGCRAVIEKRPRAFWITVPAPGLVRGAGWGLLVATPLVIGVTILLAVISYHDVPTRGGVPVPQMRYVPPVFFSLVSIVLLLAMINLAGRRVLVSIVGDMLWLEGTQPLAGTKRGKWKRWQLFAICAGPQRRLEVHSRNRPPFT